MFGPTTMSQTTHLPNDVIQGLDRMLREKDLGVHLSIRLGGKKTLRLVRRTFRNIDKAMVTTFHRTSVCPYVEYASNAWFEKYSIALFIQN